MQSQRYKLFQLLASGIVMGQ
jgi:hypothetical protein